MRNCCGMDRGITACLLALFLWAVSGVRAQQFRVNIGTCGVKAVA